jgi:hypothetical protein
MTTFKLRGKRILINKPEKRNTGIELTLEAEQELELQWMKSWKELEVYAIGSDVTEVKVGDKVYLPTYVLQNAEVIDMQEEGIKLMIGEQDIAIIW